MGWQNSTDSRPQRQSSVPWGRYLAVTVGAVMLLGLTGGSLAWLLAGRHDREALELLASTDPEARRVGAWRTTQHDSMLHSRRAIIEALESRSEAVPAVRESYVHALGRTRDADCFPLIASVLQNDPDAYVRHTAWIAAARVDPEGFRRLAAEVPERDEAWDELGRACAWLELGELRGIDDLLEWAAAGEVAQQRVASLALMRGVAPLLDAAGRWPRAYVVREGERWSRELVDLVAARLVGLDVQAVADQIAPSVERAAEVRRVVRRLTSTRDRIARLLVAIRG